ncbi:MAG: TIGR03000 domain-containing protein [Gemmataceae bacterium]
MRSHPVRWLAAAVAVCASAPVFAGDYVITPYGAYATPFGASPFGGYPYYASAGVGYNPYALAGGFGVGGLFTMYGPYNQLPVGAYAAYPPAYAYNGVIGAYSGGYLPQVGMNYAGYANLGYGSYIGYNTPSRYNAYPSTINFVPALYYGQHYASYVPISGYGPYTPPLNAYTAEGIYRPGGYVGYDPGPSVSYYRGPAPSAPSEPAAPPNKAVIDIEVPASAKVWFGDTETKQTGTKRSFTSPALDGTSEFYKYEIKAAWTENGKPVERSQTVYVRAGERSNVLFLK